MQKIFKSSTIYLNKLKLTSLVTVFTIIKHIFSFPVSEFLDLIKWTSISFTNFHTSVNASFYLDLKIQPCQLKKR